MPKYNLHAKESGSTKLPVFKVKVKKKTQHPNLLTLISINLNPKEKFTKYI